MTNHFELGFPLRMLNQYRKRFANIHTSKLACHCAVLGQSGSGKSFFLSRLIEELVLKTKAQVIILDPNSDFVYLARVDKKAWENPKLEKYFLPSDTLIDFKKQWENHDIIQLSNRNLEENVRRIRINWGSLNLEEMALLLGIDVRADAELYWYLITNRVISEERWEAETAYTFHFFLKMSRKIRNSLQDKDNGIEDFLRFEESRILKDSIGKQGIRRYLALIQEFAKFDIWITDDDEVEGNMDLQELMEKVVLEEDPPCRVVEVDLQSVKREEEKLLIAHCILSNVWQFARDKQSQRLLRPEKEQLRKPIFLVIDEAHNLVPSVRVSKSIQLTSSHISRIAAEGRKYDLFLILSTQRPKKLHPEVLSECDNLFLLHMTNAEDVEYIRKVFGGPSARNARNCLQFNVGDLLLIGPAVGAPLLMHAAPRRTVQGGASLSNKWAKPFENF